VELTAGQLGVALGGRTVLRDVSLRFVPGRVTAILGPNGAGKSTLLKAAAGLVPVTGGTVRIDERDVAALDPRERARLIGYLPQGAAAAWNVPAADLVALGRLPHRAPFAAESPEDRAAVARAMAAADMTELATRPVGELSGGERARVFFARVLAGEPEWLLADEPLAALDPAHQIDILDRLREVATSGRGVVIVLHDLLLAGRAADDIVLLKRGEVLAQGSARDVLTVENVRAAFDIRVEVSIDEAGRPRCVPIGR
jgi:iron complex transport system ATP-binding protein